MEHPSISRQHAAVMHTQQGFVVMDLGSAHGSYISPAPEKEKGHTQNSERHDLGLTRSRKIPKLEAVRLLEGQQVVFGASKRIYTLRLGGNKATNSALLSPLLGARVHTLRNQNQGREEGSPGDEAEVQARTLDKETANESISAGGKKRKRLVTFAEDRVLCTEMR